MTLMLREDLRECVRKVYAAFPEPSAVLRDGAPLAADAGSSLEMAAEVLNAAADDPLIPNRIITQSHTRIAERAGCLPVSEPEALLAAVGRLAVGKPFMTTPTSFHPDRYDELAYDYTTERQRATVNPQLSGVIASEPKLQFTYQKATVPRMHALLMHIELDYLSSDHEYTADQFLPAHVAALAIGQGAIRQYIKTTTEIVEGYPPTAAPGSAEGIEWQQRVADLKHAVDVIDALCPILHSLGKPAVQQAEAITALQHAEQMLGERPNNPARLARPINRRARQNARALQPRRP